ncbi:MAG: hypothetical protein ACRC6B_09865, partial [Fusobacteriaceae bacterium]
MNRVGGFVSKSGTVLKDSADLSKLAAEDYNETLQILSEMQAAGVMSFDTMRKMFTGRNVTQIAGVLAQIDGDLAGYNRRMTESSDIVRVTEQASKTWVHELTTLKQALGDASTGLGTFMDSFAPFLSVINNGIQSVTGNVSVMKSLTAVMSAMTTGAFVLITALMIANKAFRETASAAAWNGVKSIDKLALGFGGGILKILMEVKSILGPTGMIIAGLATAAIGATVAVYSYAKAEKQRIDALKKAVLAEKQRLSVTVAYAQTLEVFSKSAIKALTPVSALEKGVSDLSESFTYAIGGSKDAADAVIDFIDAVAKKAADLKQIEDETPKNAKDLALKQNASSTNYKEIGQRISTAIFTDLKPEDRVATANLIQDPHNMVAVNEFMKNNPNAAPKELLVSQGSVGGEVKLSAESVKLIMGYKISQNVEMQKFVAQYAKTNGKKPDGNIISEVNSGMSYGYNQSEERVLGAEKYSYQLAEAQQSAENAKKQNEIEKMNLYTKFGQTNTARVNKDKERAMKGGITKASDLEKRLNSPTFESYMTPDLKNMRKFLKELKGIDSKLFKDLSIEEATQIYSDWSNLLAENISEAAQNLLILSTAGGPDASTQAILNDMTADSKGLEEAVGIDAAKKLTDLSKDTKMTESEKHDALIKIMKDNMNHAAQKYMIGLVNHYSEAFTASGKEAYVLAEVNKSIVKNQKEQAKKEAESMTKWDIKTLGKRKFTKEEVYQFSEENYQNYDVSRGQIAQYNKDEWEKAPDMSIINQADLPTVVETTKELKNGTGNTSESVSKYFNKIHAELVAVADSFDKFAIKGNFSDRIKILQNKLKVSASTLNDQIISLYESNIESVHGGVFKKADASTKENAVNNFASKMSNVTTAQGRTEAINSMGLKPHETQKAITEMKVAQGNLLDDSHVELIEREKEMLKFLTGLELPSDIKTKVYANMAESFTKETDLLIANAEKDGMDDQQIARLKQSRAKLSKGYMLDPDSIEALTKNFEDLKVGEFDLSALQARVTELLMSASKEDHEKA